MHNKQIVIELPESLSDEGIATRRRAAAALIAAFGHRTAVQTEAELLAAFSANLLHNARADLVVGDTGLEPVTSSV